MSGSICWRPSMANSDVVVPPLNIPNSATSWTGRHVIVSSRSAAFAGATCITAVVLRLGRVFLLTRGW
jgi:hypothetical protein